MFFGGKSLRSGDTRYKAHRKPKKSVEIVIGPLFFFFFVFALSLLRGSIKKTTKEKETKKITDEKGKNMQRSLLSFQTRCLRCAKLDATRKWLI